MVEELRRCQDATDNAPFGPPDRSERTRKRENHVLRSICAFAALALVVVHCGIPGYAGDLVLGVGRFAIPVFLMLSGYYCFSDDGYAEARITRKTMHILKLVIFAKLLYTLLDLAYFCSGVMSWDEFVRATLLWSTTNMHLWFLYSLFLMYVFWWLLGRLGVDYEKVYFLIPLVLFLDILFAEALPLAGIDTTAIGEMLYPFTAIPFFMIGNALHRYRRRLEGLRILSIRCTAALILLGGVMSAVETTLLPGANLYIGSIILAVSLFVFSYRVPEDRLRCRWLEYIGRNLAVWIYVLHPAVISLLVTALGPLASETWFFYAEVVLAMLLSIAAALLVQTVSRRLSGRVARRA